MIYYAFFKFNLLIFDQFAYSYGVHWIFIPSGIQLVLVLSAMESAAMGIVIASWFMGYESFFTGSLLFTFVTGWIAGLSPLIARKIALDFLHIEEDLGNLTFKGIVQTSIIFALISATADDTDEKTNCTLPAMMLVNASGMVLYGTCTGLTPAA